MSDLVIPNGWKKVKFDDVAKQVKDIVDIEKTGLERYVAGEHMETDSFRIRQWGLIGDGYLGPAFHMRFKKGHILYGSRRTYLRKVAIADFDGICANTTFVIEPKIGIAEGVLPFIMQSERFVAHSIKNSKGSTNPYINWKDIGKYEFPLPPLAEQERIVEILWAVENSIWKTNCAMEASKRYNNRIMDHLFHKGINHKSYKDSPLGKVPNSWIIGKFTDYIDFQEGPGIMATDFKETGVPLLRLVNVNEEYTVLTGCNYLSHEKVDIKWNQFRLKEHDVLITCSASTGLVSEVTKDCEGAIAYTGIMRLRPKKGLNRGYMKLFVSSELFFKQINLMKTGSVIQHYGPYHLKRMYIPIPPEPEQERIIEVMLQINYYIRLHVQNITNLKNMKNQLLNDLLSGKRILRGET